MKRRPMSWNSSVVTRNPMMSRGNSESVTLAGRSVLRNDASDGQVPKFVA